MSLFDLGKQYYERSLAITDRIHELNKELKNKKGNDLIVYKRRIYSLYIDALDCRRKSEHLMNYYRRGYNDENNIQL